MRSLLDSRDTQILQVENKRYRLQPSLKISPVKMIGLLVIAFIFAYAMITIGVVCQQLGLLKLPDIRPLFSASLPGTDFPARIWLDDVNSLEKARYADSRYTGMEIDVMFDDKRQSFVVNRPYTPSIGLPLHALIDEIKKPHHHFYWLDFKNLTATNKQAALSELCRITQKYNIHSNIIVESSNPAALTDFSRRGFYTSYYLPDIDPVSASAEVLKAHILVISHNLAGFRVNALSANSKQYILIKKYFGNYDMLLWNFTDNPLALKLTQYKLLKDPKVKVLLVDEKYPGFR